MTIQTGLEPINAKTLNQIEPQTSEQSTNQNSTHNFELNRRQTKLNQMVRL